MGCSGAACTNGNSSWFHDFWQVLSFVSYSESAKKCHNDFVSYVDSYIFAVVLMQESSDDYKEVVGMGDWMEGFFS